MRSNSGSVLVHSDGGRAVLPRKVRLLWDVLEVQLWIVVYLGLNI